MAGAVREPPGFWLGGSRRTLVEVKLQQLQFPGVEGPTTATRAVRGSSQAVDKLTEVALERFASPHDPPVGLRGSIPERLGLADRLERRNQNRARWKSFQARGRDEGFEDTDEPLTTHPTTGLPAVGEIKTADLGMKQAPESAIPQGISFHGGTVRAWMEHGRDAEVVTSNLMTPQREISAHRLHEVLADPGTHDNNEIRGLPKDKPRVFRDRVHDREILVDGNHRIGADLLQGKLFSNVRLVDNRDLPGMRRTNTRVREAVARSNENPNINHADFVAARMNDRYYGTGNW